jgi:hypothetical protein
LAITNVFFASFIFPSNDSPFAPKNSSQSLNTSSWVKVRGRSVRYANPVVAKTSSRRAASCESSSELEDQFERVEREMIGNEEKEVDMVAGVRKRACKGERLEVCASDGEMASEMERRTNIDGSSEHGSAVHFTLIYSISP